MNQHWVVSRENFVVCGNYRRVSHPWFEKEPMMSKNIELTEEEKAYKPITENPIKVDLKEWESLLDIFGLLKRKLGLPDFCGDNWDAIWDSAWGFGSDPVLIEFYGVSEARERFPEDVDILLEIFDDLHKECPRIEYAVVD